MSATTRELRDVWVRHGDQIVAEGDAETITAWLATKLEEVAVADGGWRILYRHRDSGEFWELSYPPSELHGGGPRLLRQVDINNRDEWS